MLENEQNYLEMSLVEQSHWWYRSLHDLVLTNIKKHFARNDISILDAGCGTGGCLLHLKNSGYSDISGFDLSETAVEICNKKGLLVSHLNVNEIEKFHNGKRFDVIVCNDVFYFLSLEERKSTINKMFGLLNYRGIVIMNLPALKAFRGIHDVVVGISERFNIKHVEQMGVDRCFNKSIYYWPFFLSPLIFIERLKQRVVLGLKKNVDMRADIQLPNKMINQILYRIVKFENLALSFKPFGSSMLLVLSRKQLK